jgi:hypothetical protein
MKDFNSLSGRWTGQSMQEGFRLTERIELRIRKNRFAGHGSDVDGEFLIEGIYDPTTEAVEMVRRYVRAPRNPDQEGYPFIYEGKWDGALVFGRWYMSTEPQFGDVFEMWPEREEEIEERAIRLEVQTLALPGPR